MNNRKRTTIHLDEQTSEAFDRAIQSISSSLVPVSKTAFASLVFNAGCEIVMKKLTEGSLGKDFSSFGKINKNEPELTEAQKKDLNTMAARLFLAYEKTKHIFGDSMFYTQPIHRAKRDIEAFGSFQDDFYEAFLSLVKHSEKEEVQIYFSSFCMLSSCYKKFNHEHYNLCKKHLEKFEKLMKVSTEEAVVFGVKNTVEFVSDEMLDILLRKAQNLIEENNISSYHKDAIKEIRFLRKLSKKNKEIAKNHSATTTENPKGIISCVIFKLSECSDHLSRFGGFSEYTIKAYSEAEYWLNRYIETSDQGNTIDLSPVECSDKSATFAASASE